jgi:hypothetical protein
MALVGRCKEKKAKERDVRLRVTSNNIKAADDGALKTIDSNDLILVLFANRQGLKRLKAVFGARRTALHYD